MHRGITSDAEVDEECVGFDCFRATVVVPDDLDANDDLDDDRLDDLDADDDVDDADDPDANDDPDDEVDPVDLGCVPLPAWRRIAACFCRAGGAAEAGSVATVCAEARGFGALVDPALGLDEPHAASATVSASPTVKLTSRSRPPARRWSAVSGI